MISAIAPPKWHRGVVYDNSSFTFVFTDWLLIRLPTLTSSARWSRRDVRPLLSRVMPRPFCRGRPLESLVVCLYKTPPPLSLGEQVRYQQHHPTHQIVSKQDENEAHPLSPHPRPRGPPRARLGRVRGFLFLVLAGAKVRGRHLHQEGRDALADEAGHEFVCGG